MTNSAINNALIPLRPIRGARVGFRALPSELANLKARAKSCGLSVSEFLRRASVEVQAIPDKQPTHTELKAAARIAKIGSGLTYLLRLCEIHRFNIDEIRPVILEIQSLCLDIAAELRSRRA